MVAHLQQGLGQDRKAIADRLGAVGWGAFLVWVGIALLTGLGLGIGLIGVGVITWGTQVGRRALHLPLEGFWVGAGALFLLAGLWELLGIGIPLIPILLVLAGIAALAIGLRGS